VYSSDIDQIKLINVNSEDADMWECYLDRGLQYKEQKARLENTPEYNSISYLASSNPVNREQWVINKLRDRKYEYHFEQVIIMFIFS
jgi:hypothetical protein